MDTDISIVGGGIIGLSTALGLSDYDLNVSVFDTKALSLSENSENLRVYAINQGSIHLFEKLRVWDTIKKTRVGAYEKMHVWDEGSHGVLHFDCVEFAKAYLGYIIEENVIRNALLARLKTKENVRLLPETTLTDVETKEDSIILHGNNRLYKARLLLGADGANSWVKKQLAFNSHEKPYGHHALIATLTLEKSHEKTAWQIFTKHGPLAFLPLSDQHRCSIVFSANKEMINELMSLNDDLFCKAIKKLFQCKLGNVVKTSKRISFPLIERHTRQYVKPRVALLGDALHTIHPLAGLGVNLGLKDVADFLTCVGENPEELDSFSTLRRYERMRKGHNSLVMKTMAGIKHMFSPQGMPSSIRGAGMNFISNCMPLKKIIIQQALM